MAAAVTPVKPGSVRIGLIEDSPLSPVAATPISISTVAPNMAATPVAPYAPGGAVRESPLSTEVRPVRPGPPQLGNTPRSPYTLKTVNALFGKPGNLPTRSVGALNFGNEPVVHNAAANAGAAAANAGAAAANAAAANAAAGAGGAGAKGGRRRRGKKSHKKHGKKSHKKRHVTRRVRFDRI